MANPTGIPIEVGHSNNFYVRVYADPFTKKFSRTPFQVGTTIAETLAQLELPNDASVEVSINGVDMPPIVRDQKPRIGSMVKVVLKPGGVGVAAATLAINWFAVSTAATKFALLAAGMVYDYRTQIHHWIHGKPDHGTADHPTNIGASGQNRAAKGKMVPIVAGEMRVTPPLAMEPSSEYVGNSNEQFFKTAVVWSHAPVTLRDIKVGEEGIAAVIDGDGEWQRHDLEGLGNRVLVDREDETRLQVTPSSTPHLTRTSLLTEKIRLVFKGNLYNYAVWSEQRGRDPDQTYDYHHYAHGSVTWTLTIKYRPTKDGRAVGDGWSDADVVTVTHTISNSLESIVHLDNGPDTNLGAGARRPLTRGAYDINVTGAVTLTAPTIPSGWGSSVEYFQSTTMHLTKVIDETESAPVTRPGVAVSAFKIFLDSDSSRVVREISGICGKKVFKHQGSGVWGTDRTNAAHFGISKNPADWFVAYLTDSDINRAPLSRDALDLARLGEWWDFCNDNEFGYSRVVEGRATLNDLLNEVAAAGRAQPVLAGKHAVVISKPVSESSWLFTPRNTANFQMQIDNLPVPHAYRVTFFNEEIEWEEDVMVVYRDGYNLGGTGTYTVNGVTKNNARAVHIEDLHLGGVTKPSQVYKLARYRLAALLHRPRLITFDIDYVAMAVELGDRVTLAHDAALIGQTWGRIKKATSGTPSRLTLDEQVTFEAGKTYKMVVGKQNGDNETLQPGGSGTTKTVTVEALNGVQAGDPFTFGEGTADFIVANIEAQSEGRATLTLVDYAEVIFNAAANIPDHTPVIHRPVGPTHTGPDAPFIIAIESDENALPVDLKGTPLPNIKVTFEERAADPENPKIRQAARATLQWKPENEEQWQTTSVQASDGVAYLAPVRAGVLYDIRLRFVDSEQGISNWTTAQHRAVGLSAAPPQVSTFTVREQGGTSMFAWTYFNPPRDVVAFEIRYASETGVRHWDRMKVLAVVGNVREAVLPSIENATYAIKAIDANGNYSANAIYRDAIGGPSRVLKAVATLNESTPDAGGGIFTATKDNVAVYNSTLQLEQIELVIGQEANIALNYHNAGNLATLEEGDIVELYVYPYDGSDPLASATFISVSGDTITVQNPQPNSVAWQNHSGDEVWIRGRGSFLGAVRTQGITFNNITRTVVETVGTYVTAIVDLGAIYEVDVHEGAIMTAPNTLSNLMSAIDDMSEVEDMSGGGEADPIEVQMRVAKTAAIRNAWDNDDWGPLSRSGATGRYFQFRLRLSTRDENVSPVVSGLTFTIYAAARVEHGTAASSSSSDTQVHFGTAFEVTDPTVTLQIEGASAGDVASVVSKSKTGFRFKVLNSSGNRIVKTVGWLANGFGAAAS